MKVSRVKWFIVALLMCPLAAHAQNLNEEFLAAARKGDPVEVKALLDKGADVNAKTQYGATALAYACDKGHVEVVKLLLERGANVNVRDSFYGEVPLGWAIMRSRTEIIKLLLDKGAQGRERVLMAGAQEGNIEMVKLVLEKGELKPETLTSALSAATRGKHAEVAELLKKAGAKSAAVPAFQVDPETLKSYTGVYKHEQVGDLTFTLKEGKLVGRLTGQDEFTVAAFDKSTFTVVELDGINIKFNVEGDKVVSLTLKQGAFTGVFKKAEK